MPQVASVRSPEMPRVDLSGAGLFLDFDGTLVEIAGTPDGIDVPHDLVALLDRLAGGASGRVAIVSGRTVAELEAFLPGFDGALVGTHGAELRIDGTYDVAVEAHGPDIARIRDRVARWRRQNPDVIVEEKPVSVALHFRTTPEAEPAGRAILADLADNAEGFEVKNAKEAVEIMPARISKDLGLAALLSRWGACHPIAIGDDTTDEDMFRFVQARGGLAIKVGGGATCADHVLPDVRAVRDLLRGWSGAAP